MHRGSSAGTGARGTDDDHDCGNVDATAEKAHGERRGATAALGAAEAVAEIAALGAGLPGKAAWFAAIAGAVQNASAAAAVLRAGLLGEVLIDPQQQAVEVRITGTRAAHCKGLGSWKTRDSPLGVVCARCLREIPSATSRKSLKPPRIPIDLRAHAHTSPSPAMQ